MVHDSPFEICIERAKYYTESYKETEKEHPSIRAAKALKKTLENMSIFLLDEEQLVGHRTSKLLGVILPVERGDPNYIVKLSLRNLKKRKVKPFHISKENERLLKEQILPYWEGKTVSDKRLEMHVKTGLISKKKLGNGELNQIDPLRKFLLINGPKAGITVIDDQGHLVMGHKNIVKWGFEGIKRRAAKKLEEVNASLRHSEQADGGNLNILTGISLDSIDFDDMEKQFRTRFSKNAKYSLDNKRFLEAVMICCEACTNFIQRFANLTREQARKTNKKRAMELERISKICAWISNNKPRNFREALQLIWFNEIIGNISHGLGGILAVGRPDQYLYPFYKTDMEAGIISNEEVTELLEEFLIKLSSNLLFLPSFARDESPELGEDNVALTVGGIDENGKDATNELSYLFCDAIENIKCMTVSFSARIAPNANPRKWVNRIIDIHSKTCGTAIYNDDVIIPALQKTGVTLEDARDYAIVGCVEPAPQGNAFPITAGNAISLPHLLYFVLNSGKTRAGSKIRDMEINSKEFKSYEDVWETFLNLIKLKVDQAAKCANIKDNIFAEYYPNPFISMTLDGCMENALDMTQGGAKYNYNTLSSDGIATIVNSLAALRKVVFDDKEITMEQMIEILENNFKDKESFRLKLVNKVPKFGNDDDYVDAIARDLVDAFCDEIMGHSSIRAPGIFRPLFFSAGTHVLAGRFLGATPDGRKAGEPVSNSLSPSNGSERNGPTAVFNSLSKLNTSKISSGLSLNMRMLPALMSTKAEREKLADLLLTYFENGGMHVQINVVNQENLVEAQLHPEKFRDLIVRVSGYCAYFIFLEKDLQNDIISRFQFENI